MKVIIIGGGPGGYVCAIRLESTIDEILTTIHAHPTVSEAIYEASHIAKGYAIHIPKNI